MVAYDPDQTDDYLVLEHPVETSQSSLNFWDS